MSLGKAIQICVKDAKNIMHDLSCFISVVNSVGLDYPSQLITIRRQSRLCVSEIETVCFITFGTFCGRFCFGCFGCSGGFVFISCFDSYGGLVLVVLVVRVVSF